MPYKLTGRNVLITGGSRCAPAILMKVDDNDDPRYLGDSERSWPRNLPPRVATLPSITMKAKIGQRQRPQRSKRTSMSRLCSFKA